MKKLLIAFFLLISFLIGNLQAQTDQRTTSTRIADILAKMPAGDPVQLAAMMHQMEALGADGLVQMSSALAAPGKRDNTKTEYAINSFSYYATGKGNQSLRDRCADAYVQALAKTGDDENKAFLIRQLEITGNDKAVPALQAYLSDQRLCEPAARALVRIHSDAANKALLDGLLQASGKNRITLVEALGDTRYAPANSHILALANDPDFALRKVALYALANIADPSSAATLAAAAGKSGYTFDSTLATAAYLQYAHQLAAGSSLAADKIAMELLKKCTKPGQLHTRAAALALLTEIRGEKSVPLLIAATNDKDFKYRKAALSYAEKFTSDASIGLWLKRLSAAPAPVKAEIITMLGNTHAKTALPAVRLALKNKNEAVSLAAIKAAEQIGQQDVLTDLLDLLKTADTTQASAIRQSLLVMKGNDVARQVSEALPGAGSAQAKASLVDVLAARGAHEAVGNVLSLANNNDPIVRKAVFSGLANIVGQENLPQLFKLLTAASNPGEISNTQSAIVAAVNEVNDPVQRVALIGDQMNNAPGKQSLFFPVLSGIGGKPALQLLTGRFDTGDENTRRAVVEALAASTDPAAALPLLNIARKSAGRDYQDRALSAYIRLAGKLSLPADEQLLMLRNAMAIATTNRQKELVLDQVAECKTFPALMFAGNYLNDPQLQHDAADAVRQIALSNSGWYGEKVRSLLERTMPLLQGSDADYERQAIRKHLAELPTGEGFVSLFNGKDLSGWKGLVANPVERAKMDAKTLAKEQAKADERMRTGWYVKDGELVFSGKGDNLCTIKKYGDFEMFVDWKITSQGDAGIYLRGTPQVQIWDTSRVDVGAQVGSGGLYNNQSHESKPSKLADNAIGEWNSFHIIMKGDRVTVYLNGEIVVDNVTLENYWDRKLPIFPEEQIELQAHGTYVAYRDLYIREIPRPKPFTLSDEEKKAGFKVLFDGTNMHEWVGNTSGYVIEDGNMVVKPQHGVVGNLYTKDEYSDFVFRFDFQLTPGGNNGVGIRAPLEGDAAYVGMEIQILDDGADIYKNLHEYQYHGSVYGVIPAKRGYLKPVGEWNSEEITAKGNRIKVVLNGTTILDGDIAEASRNGTLDGKDHPGLRRTTGHIGFLGHGDVVRFRNIRVSTDFK